MHLLTPSKEASHAYVWIYMQVYVSTLWLTVLMRICSEKQALPLQNLLFYFNCAQSLLALTVEGAMKDGVGGVGM